VLIAADARGGTNHSGTRFSGTWHLAPGTWHQPEPVVTGRA